MHLFLPCAECSCYVEDTHKSLGNGQYHEKLNAATCHDSRDNKSMDFDYCYGSMNDHQGVSQKNDVECNMHVWLWLSNISMFSL